AHLPGLYAVTRRGRNDPRQDALPFDYPAALTPPGEAGGEALSTQPTTRSIAFPSEAVPSDSRILHRSLEQVEHDAVASPVQRLTLPVLAQVLVVLDRLDGRRHGATDACPAAAANHCPPDRPVDTQGGADPDSTGATTAPPGADQQPETKLT